MLPLVLIVIALSLVVLFATKRYFDAQRSAAERVQSENQKELKEGIERSIEELKQSIGVQMKSGAGSGITIEGLEVGIADLKKGMEASDAETKRSIEELKESIGMQMEKSGAGSRINIEGLEVGIADLKKGMEASDAETKRSIEELKQSIGMQIERGITQANDGQSTITELISKNTETYDQLISDNTKLRSENQKLLQENTQYQKRLGNAQEILKKADHNAESREGGGGGGWGIFR